jgi:hypothetical protein
VFATSPFFWEHLQVHSKEMWNMEQTVRRILKKDARYFTSNQPTTLATIIQNKGTNFDKKFAYIYTDWIKKFHNYIQEPNYAIFSNMTIPSDTNEWFITIQLYPRVFYEDQTTHTLWRKGGLKIEMLDWDNTIEEWVRTDANWKNARTIEIAWHCTDRIHGIHKLEDDNITKV